MDRDGNGRLDAGDTLRYTVEITNCGSAPAENVQFTAQSDPNTQFLADSVQVSAPVPATNCTSQVIPPPAPTSTPVTPPSDAPEVENTTPADGATEVALNTNITLQFNKRVNVTGDWFEIVCSISGTFNVSSANVTVTGGSRDFTFDPNVDLQVGETCTVTVFAANVTDRDNNDPPDNMVADYVFTFTTESPPTVANTNPVNGATAVPNTADLVVTFDEPVTVTAASFTLECPAGTPFAGGFAVTGTGTATVTINPTGNLPSGTVCQVVIVAANVNDVDANDPPDLLDGNGDNVEGDDYVFAFTTDVDAAPTVLTVFPANGAVAVPSNTTVEFVFSELVDIANAAAFSVECPAGLPMGFTVTTPAILPASATNFVLTPAGNLPDATTCTVTVFAGAVTDTDLDDPPDNMVADFVSTFTTEAPPNVTTTNPANGAVGVATGSNIVVNFDEPVDVTAASFTIECPPGGTNYTYTIVGSGTASITLDPIGNLFASSTCIVTVIAAQVADVDLIDPPDNMVANYVFAFDTIVDLAPTVDQPNIAPASTSTGPNSASLDNPVSTTPTITIPFSEAVDVATGAFTLVCNATPIPVVTVPPLPALGQTSINISPVGAIAEGANCVLTVVAANINDSDVDDPPNLMVVDFTLSFASDTAPMEVLTETEVGGVFQDVTGAGATNVDLDSDIQITFSEAVTVTFPANGLQCPAGNNIPVTVTTNNAATIVLNPNVNLTVNTLCVLNIPSANISDVDTNDAPDNPLAAVAHNFQTVDDDAPTVTTNPAAGGANVAVNSNITVTFNEAVTLTGAWFGLNCSLSGNRVSTGELTGTGIIIIENTPDLVYTVDPTVDLVAGDVCTITIDSANVVDNDAIDPPSELDGDASADVVDGDADDYVAVFSTADMPPQVLNTIPAAAALVEEDQVVTINFTEAVDVAAGAFTFECPTGTPLTSAFTPSVPLPAVGITTIDLTPVDPMPFGAACTVAIDSGLVVDTDPVDPPNFLDGDSSGDLIDDADNFFLNFNVDAAPILLDSEVEIAGDSKSESEFLANLPSEVLSFGTDTVYAQSAVSIPVGPINVGTIPAGSKVTVTFDVLVRAVIPSGTTHISLQGTISGSNFASILTDDPETAVVTDATFTPLGALQAVRGLPQTGETVWWQVSIVWALRLTLLSAVLAGLVTIRRRVFRSI